MLGVDKDMTDQDYITLLRCAQDTGALYFEMAPVDKDGNMEVNIVMMAAAMMILTVADVYKISDRETRCWFADAIDVLRRFKKENGTDGTTH